jgi:predicted membrane channel-forming protein YqfA (hemolysin III family)
MSFSSTNNNDHNHSNIAHKATEPSSFGTGINIKSILSVHTETGNTWTHLIGCLAFFFIFLWFVTRPDTHILFQVYFAIRV